MQRISDKPESKCPNCGKEIKRIISQTSFALKGGGWYKDGYSSTSGGTQKSPPAPKKDKSSKDK